MGFLSRLLGLGRKPAASDRPPDDLAQRAPVESDDLHRVISTAPPPRLAGFIPGHEFQKRDMPARLRNLGWFRGCGKPLALELSMPIRPVANWDQATASCLGDEWSNIQDRASEQLFQWLREHAVAAFRTWSDTVEQHNKQTIVPIVVPPVESYVSDNKLDPELVHCVRRDIRQALLENTFIPTGHRSYFFLELFEIYEAGHFPCGWRGAWPTGELLYF